MCVQLYIYCMYLCVCKMTCLATSNDFLHKPANPVFQPSEVSVVRVPPHNSDKTKAGLTLFLTYLSLCKYSSLVEVRGLVYI